MKVRLEPIEFLLKTTSGNYMVSLFNLKKYSAEMGAGGIVGMGMDIRYVNSANKDAIKLKNIIKSHSITTYDLKTNADDPGQQSRGVLLFITYLLVIELVVYGIVTLASHRKTHSYFVRHVPPTVYVSFI